MMIEPSQPEDEVGCLGLSLAADLLEAIQREIFASANFGSLEPKNRLALAAVILRSRKRRANRFPKIEFGEPCWDIILDLYIAARQGQSVSISSLCIVAGVPTSTAMRCINAMLESGELTRQRDPSDGRRWFVRLSEDLVEAVDGWLDEYSAMIAVSSIPGLAIQIADGVGPRRPGHAAIPSSLGTR